MSELERKEVNNEELDAVNGGVIPVALLKKVMNKLAEDEKASKESSENT